MGCAVSVRSCAPSAPVKVRAVPLSSNHSLAGQDRTPRVHGVRMSAFTNERSPFFLRSPSMHRT